MGHFVHNVTKDLLRSVPPDELPEALENYTQIAIDDIPALHAALNIPRKYRKLVAGAVVEMTAFEKYVTDAQIDAAKEQSLKDAAKDAITAERVLRAIVVVFANQINDLAAGTSDAPFNRAQWINLIRSEIQDPS